MWLLTSTVVVGALLSAFNTAKRLLGLSYLWTGSINGVKLQVWATWLFYAILIDLADDIADELALPFDRPIVRNGFSWTISFQSCLPQG